MIDIFRLKKSQYDARIPLLQEHYDRQTQRLRARRSHIGNRVKGFICRAVNHAIVAADCNDQS